MGTDIKTNWTSHMERISADGWERYVVMLKIVQILMLYFFR
jgi:hypothetical protein